MFTDCHENKSGTLSRQFVIIICVTSVKAVQFQIVICSSVNVNPRTTVAAALSLGENDVNVIYS